MAPVPGGATSLYDTVAAAYATATDRYVDGRFNAIVVVTDGRNEDPGSRTLPGLLDDVRRKYESFRSSLEVVPTTEHGLDYVRRVHSEFLPPSIRSASAVVTPGAAPASMSACLTQPRTDSTP